MKNLKYEECLIRFDYDDEAIEFEIWYERYFDDLQFGPEVIGDISSSTGKSMTLDRNPSYISSAHIFELYQDLKKNGFEF